MNDYVFFFKKDDIQVKVKPKTYNSFVPSGAKFEFENDIIDVELKHATSNTRYGLVAIDNYFFLFFCVPKLPKLFPLKIEHLRP